MLGFRGLGFRSRVLCSTVSHAFGSRTHSHDHMASERLLCLSSIYGICAEVVVDD